METNLSEIPSFKAPLWCFNGHVHTIARSIVGSSAKLSGNRIKIATTDDDFLELDVVDQQNGWPVVVLFHGLEGDTRRYYMVELMRSCIRKGYSVVAVNFRSCGSEMNTKQIFYHSGSTNDYATVFRWIQCHFSNRLIAAVGFSLGGNALLKSLGEEKENHLLTAAVAVSVPYDLKMGSMKIARGFNRIYEYRFLQTLRRKLADKRKKYPDLPVFTGRTLYDFDDQIISKIHGFEDADDYYSKCSAKFFLADIQKPTLLIHSKKDPLCPVEGIPLNIIRKNTSLDYILTEEGGHVGFWSSPRGWLNQVIVNYLNNRLTQYGF